MRRRRVLWVSSPVSSSFAGGERVVERLVEGLDAWDHEFLGGSEALHELFRAGGRGSRCATAGLEPVNPRNVLLFPGSIAWGLAHFLRHRDRFAQADVIVCPTSFTEPLTVFPWVVRLLGKRPIALWQNARIPRSIRWSPLAPALRAILGRCRSVFLSGSQERTWLRLGLAGPATVIRNGVRVEELAPRGPADGTPTFGFLGRMHAQKGVDTMLEALARPDAPRPVRVLLGGDGPDLERFRSLGASLARPGVELTWLGWVAEPRRFYEQIDLLVVPSREEAFGLTLIEAWERGVPVLTSDAEGLVELQGFARGAERELVFRAGDAEQLAERTRWFLARREELGSVERRAERHAIVARHFDERRVVREYEALFEDVLTQE